MSIRKRIFSKTTTMGLIILSGLWIELFLGKDTGGKLFPIYTLQENRDCEKENNCLYVS